ncbi:MAG: hypothetical protein LBH43_16865 [Treponema sp.]|jgi:Tfp pilus assembly protein PilE|nr:hypothetical protein [Treponema sp.]
MTFIELISALAILCVFLLGFSQLFLPAYNAWNKVMMESRSVQTINFIAESFKNECAKPDRNIENWKKMASTAKEMESYEISELWKGDKLRALKLKCRVSGEDLEIIGLCMP